MQKSMVQELSVLTRSTIFSGQSTSVQSSQINTHLTEGDSYPLRRSRIANLPGGMKADIFNKPGFIVVFQAVEIERLSIELQTLRVKYRALMNENSNYQSYEVQIRQLTERCHQYQMNSMALFQERKKMEDMAGSLFAQVEELKRRGDGQGFKQKYLYQRQRCQQIQSQVQKWKHRYSSLEIAKNKEFQMIRFEFQQKRKSSINREVKEITIKHQNEIQALTSQIRKIRQDNEFKMHEIRKLQGYADQLGIKDRQMDNYQNRLVELENNVALLSQQNIRLTELMRTKNQQLDKLKATERDLTTKLENLRSSDQQTRSLRSEISSRNSEIKQLKTTISRIQSDYEKVSQDNSQIVEYKRLVDKSAAEVEKLSKLILQKMSQTQNLKSANKILQSRVNSMGNLTQKEISSYQERLLLQSKQHEKANAQLRNKLMQNENLKMKLSNLQKSQGKYERLQRQNEQLRGQIGQNSRKIQEFKNKIRLLEENVAITEDLENRLKQEEKLKKQSYHQRQKLNDTVRNLTIQIQTLNKKLKHLESGSSNYLTIQTQIRQYQNKVSYMTQQIDRINAQLQKRVGELQQVKQSLKSFQNIKTNTQNVEQKLVQNLAQMEKLILSLDNSRKQNDALSNQKINLQSTVKKLQNQIFSVQQEKEEMHKLLNEKRMEMSKVSKQLEGMFTKIAQHRDLQIQNQQLQKKFQNTKMLYNQLETKFAYEIKRSQNYSAQHEQLSAQITQLSQMNSVFTKEITALKKQTEDKESLITYFKRRIDVIENIIKALKQKYANQYQNSQQLKKKLDAVIQKIGFFDQMAQNLSKLAEEKNKISEENINLQTSKRLVEIQMTQSLKVAHPDFPSEQSTAVFGFGNNSTRNQSIAANISSKSSNFNGSMNFNNNSSFTRNYSNQAPRQFTFKEVNRGKVEAVSEVDISREVISQPYEQTRTEAEERDYKDSSSMSSSIINTLMTKQSVGRLQTSVSNNYEAFGYGGPSTRVRYVSSSPSQAESSPSNPNKPNYISIESQMNDPTRRVLSPVHATYDNTGVKRVTSYTHFQNGQTFNSPVISQYPSQDMNNVRTYEGGNYQKVVRNMSTEFGKPVRITSEQNYHRIN